jgi:hypothetical protein
VCDQEPPDTPVSGTEGNLNSWHFTQYGCPVYSSGEPWYTECMLITSREKILNWIQEVALDENYQNPLVINPKRVDTTITERGIQWENDWDKVPEELKPSLSVAMMNETPEGGEIGGLESLQLSDTPPQ